MRHYHWPEKKCCKKRDSISAGLLWTGLGIALIVRQAEAETIIAEDPRLYSAITASGTTRIYLLDPSGVPLSFDLTMLEVAGLSWGVDADGHKFFHIDADGRAVIPKIDTPHQVVAVVDETGTLLHALPDFLHQHGDMLIISPLTDQLARTIAEEGLIGKEAGQFVSDYLAEIEQSVSLDGLYAAILDDLINWIDGSNLLMWQPEPYDRTPLQNFVFHPDEDNGHQPAAVKLPDPTLRDTAELAQVTPVASTQSSLAGIFSDEDDIILDAYVMIEASPGDSGAPHIPVEIPPAEVLLDPETAPQNNGSNEQTIANDMTIVDGDIPNIDDAPPPLDIV